MLLCLKNDVYIWKSDFSKQIDKILKKNGFTLIDLPWDNCELLKNDKEHFTRRGNHKFVEYLRNILDPYGIDKKILILSDSTLGYWNDTGNLPYDIISYCGVGYTTHPVNFRSMSWNLIDKYDIILVIGGWNDKYTDISLVDKSIRNFTRTIKK